MEYVALLRGINVGGKNKVVMSELREQIATEKRAKNTQFSPAKAIPVSDEAQPVPAKAMAISDKRAA